jgi:hypothetical protein
MRCFGRTPANILSGGTLFFYPLLKLWILCNCKVYSATREEAITRVQVLALRVIADKLDHEESIPELDELFAISA